MHADASHLLLRADQLIGAERYPSARELLAELPDQPSTVAAHLHKAAAAGLLLADGLAGEASPLFVELAESPLPLPGTQLACGRFFLKRGQYRRALLSFGRASLLGADLGPSLAAAAWQPTLPLELLAALIKPQQRAVLGLDAMLKRRLRESLGDSDALTSYLALGADRGPRCAALRPLRSLREHARTQALSYTETHAEHEQWLELPQLYGQARQTPFAAPARTLFTCCLADVSVSWRSSVLECEDHALYDHQADELAAIPVDFGVDGQVFGQFGDALCLVRGESPAIVLDEAVVLVGAGSHGIGHWLGEFLPKLFQLTRLGQATAAPILIDAGMPVQHLEALRWFCGEQRQLIELAPWQRARVRRAWTASTLSYAPFHPAPGARLQVDRLCANIAAVDEVLGGLPMPASAEQPRRVFLARSAGLHRVLVNQQALIRIASDFGFSCVYPESLPMHEQLRLVGHASHVIGPAGSALLLAFLFGQRGQKLLDLHPQALEDTPSLTTVAQARGVEVTVFCGQTVRANAQLPGNSDYRIDEAEFAALLASWSPL